MAKRRRAANEALNSEIELPEAIIQHIQSNLDAKQAAQTTVLSKPWYNAWLTRANLDFDQRNFQKKLGNWEQRQARAAQDLSNFVNKTMKRYQDLNLKIDTLRLHMVSTGRRMANELIRKALKMGVTDLDLEFLNLEYVLPNEVLEAKSVTRLCLSACEIKIDRLTMKRKLLFQGLRYLCLWDVCISEDAVRDIVASCPLIEHLSLFRCRCLVEDNGAAMWSALLSFRAPLIEREETSVGLVVNSAIKVSEFCKLTSLQLGRVYLDSPFFHQFSHKLPCLEELTLCNCYYYKAIQISSHSLKRILLEDYKMVRFKFDVPSIRKFTYHGSKIPSVSFKSCLGEWESDVSFDSWGYNCHYPRAYWFLELKRFLTKLSQSSIYLCLPSLPHSQGDQLAKDIDFVRGVQHLPKPVVKKLILLSCSSSVDCPALLDCLFLSCHPKTIYLTWDAELLEEGKNKMLRNFKEQISLVSKSFRIPRQNMFCLRDLEKVNMEICNRTYSERRSMPCKAWLDTPETPECGRQVRLQLRLLTT